MAKRQNRKAKRIEVLRRYTSAALPALHAWSRGRLPADHPGLLTGLGASRLARDALAAASAAPWFDTLPPPGWFDYAARSAERAAESERRCGHLAVSPRPDDRGMLVVMSAVVAVSPAILAPSADHAFRLLDLAADGFARANAACPLPPPPRTADEIWAEIGGWLDTFGEFGGAKG